jgi:hypothetical protein
VKGAFMLMVGSVDLGDVIAKLLSQAMSKCHGSIFV